MIRTAYLCTTALFCLSLFSCHQKNVVEKEAQSDGLENAMRQEFRMTRDPRLNLVPRERLVEAKQYMERLILTGTGTPTGRPSALGWQERGPNNVAGRTRAILLDKRDATGNTVFVGSVSGGIFKTTNFTNNSTEFV